MSEIDCQILLWLLLGVVAILLVLIICLEYEVDKLRRDNNLLRRVLEDYFRLEDGSRRTARTIAREAGLASWLPPRYRS